MEDLFDEKLLEAIRLAEALQDGQSEEKEPEVKQETESSSPVSGRKNRLLPRLLRQVKKLLIC